MSEQKCMNAFNDYYYDNFNQMSIDARNKNLKNLFIIYKKVSLSILKYPFPILTSSQAMTLEGIGENLSFKFENLIKTYKEKIKKENIDYLSLAYQIEPNITFKTKTKSKRLRTTKRKKEVLKSQIYSDEENLKYTNKTKYKKNLINIPSYSSQWTSVISTYILYLQNNNYEINIEDIYAMSLTLKEELNKINIKLEYSNEKNDFIDLKNLGLIDEIHGKKIKINEYLIKFASMELRKKGINVIKEDNGDIDFHSYEIEKIKEKKENPENEIIKKYKAFIEKNQSKEFTDNIILIIDLREKGANNEIIKDEILNLINDKNNIKVEERNLSIGDFIWIYKDTKDNEEYIIDYLIERKTLNDLASSIMDGRYTEQKYRMKNSSFKNISYLFEGQDLSLNGLGNINKNSINTAIFHTINIHDLNIIKSNSTMETIQILIDIDRKIKKSFQFLLDKDNNKITYNTFMKLYAKTKNSSASSIFLRQLRSFDNCGSKGVELVNKCFQFPLNLYKIVQRCKNEKIKKESMKNLISLASYLYEEGEKINEENIIFYLKNKQNYSKIKKGIKSVKKLRKDAIENIIKFYGYDFFDNDYNVIDYLNFLNKLIILLN